MKNWIFKNLFKKEYGGLYCKAFNDAYKDLEETNVYNTEEKAKELADQKLLSMLSAVDYNKVVKLDKTKGIVIIGDTPAEAGRLSNLKAEADFLMQSDIWTLLQETPKELAQQSLFKISESLDDLKKGKAMLYTLSAQQNIVNLLSSYIKK